MQAAQLVHAAGESFGAPCADVIVHAVALWARDALELHTVEHALALAGVAHHAVREPDAPYHGALLAIGIRPVRDRRALPACVRRLPLIGKETP